MKRHPSDRHIRQQLEHYHTPVDAEALWANIEPVVQPKKDSRKLLFFWFTLSLVLISIFSYFIFSGNTTNPSDTETTIASQIQDTPNQDFETSANKNHNQETAVISNLSQADPTTSAQLDKTNYTTPSVAQNTSLQKQPKKQASGQSNPIQGNSATKSLSTNNNQLISKTTLAPETGNEANRSSSSQNQTQQPKSSNAFSKQLALLPVLTPAQLSQTAFPDLPKHAKTPITSSRDYGFSPWSVTLRLGIGSNLRDLRGNDNSTELLNIRNRTEEQLESFTFEGGIQWESKGNWYLRSGLGYRQSVERFSFSSTDTSTVVDDNGIIRIILDQRGNPVDTIFGEVTGQRVSILEKTTYNRLRYFEIPIIAGYTFGEGPFSFSVEAGVVPQFLVSVSGEVLDERANIGSFSEIIETGFSLSLHSAFNINYDINQSWQVQLSPTFRYQFSNLHQTEYPLSVSYHSFGLQLGLRYSW